MKPINFPAPRLGLDVRSSTTNLPAGTVKRATNVVLTDKGDFRRCPGSTLVGALAGAHSLWRSPFGTTLVAAADKLYEVTLGDTTTYEEIFQGLPHEEPVEFDDAGADIYFTAGSVLGRLCSDGLVRRPGVAELIGYAPTLAATIGGLYAGSYGVAYSLTNDLGEESPLSAVSYIDLPSGGGILLSGLVTATDVVSLNLYITAADGAELYLHDTIAWTGTASITDQKQGRQASKQGRVLMPGGTIVRFWNGRLYVATGSFIAVSDPFDAGLCNPKEGWFNTGRTITLMEPVEGGIFVGHEQAVHFYKGSDPATFQLAQVSSLGAYAHSGGRVAADFFDPEVVGSSAGLPVAIWLSDVGLTLGMPSGQVVTPQAGRIRLTAEGPARSAALWNGGVKQIVFSVESMTMGVGGPTEE
jgi:hypothetical protein